MNSIHLSIPTGWQTTRPSWPDWPTSTSTWIDIDIGQQEEEAKAEEEVAGMDRRMRVQFSTYALSFWSTGLQVHHSSHPSLYFSNIYPTNYLSIVSTLHLFISLSIHLVCSLVYLSIYVEI